MATPLDKDMLNALASFQNGQALIPSSGRTLASSVDRAISSFSHIDATSGGKEKTFDHHDFKLILDNYAKAQGLDMKGLEGIPPEDCLKAYVGKFGPTFVQAAFHDAMNPKDEFTPKNARPLSFEEINTVISTVFPKLNSRELQQDLGLLTPTGGGGKRSDVDQSPSHRGA